MYVVFLLTTQLMGGTVSQVLILDYIRRRGAES